jgi:CRP/FNR family cyclic AMP-dependent transcriptional regulator
VTDQDPLIHQLSQVSHFKRLPLKDVAVIVSAGRVHHTPAGGMIFLESQPSAGLWVLLSGLVHLIKTGPQGQEAILAVIQPVIMFNEVAALDGGSNPAGARAVEDCLLWNVAYERFQQLLENYPIIGLGLLKVLARRNRALVDQYEDLSFKTVLSRAAKLLLELSREGREPVDRRKYPNTRLAARLATAPEVFSRALKIFKQDGLIVVTTGTIGVAKPELLRICAQGLAERHSGV